MKIHFIQHEAFEAPGAYLTWAEQKGYPVSFSKVFESQPLPESADTIDMLIVLGGPQCPDTTKAQCPYFDAEAEMRLIQNCIGAGKMVIGVCLGAQLIGQSFNAPYGHSPEKEIGNFPVTLTEAGRKDANISHFGSTLTVGHWHNDMPGLTAECEVLAFSQGCPGQIIKYAANAYGFQCHLELTKQVVQGLIEHEAALDTLCQKHPFVQKPEEMLGYDYTEMNEKLHTFLNNFVQETANRK